MNKPYELSYETLILFWVSLKKSIIEIIEYCRFLKESKLERAKLKARLKNVFSGAPAGGITFIVAILFFFASLFIVPLYILAVKYNQSYLKVFVVSVLLSLVLGVKIYFDIRIWDSKKDNTAKFSINVAIDSLYFWTNVYLVIFGFEGLLRSTNESSKSNLFKKKEVAQIVETALATSYSMLIIVVVVLIILLIFLHRKKGEFESRKIKSTRTRIKGRYKYTKPRKR